MQIARSLAEVTKNRDSVVTVGTFDGVHKAHQKIIREVVARARERSGRSVVVTFQPHPKEIISKRDHLALTPAVELLTTYDEKLEIIRELGVDLVFVVDFTIEFSRKSFHEFYQEYIIDAIGVSEVIEGYDHSFGRNRLGGLEELVKLAREFQFSVVVEKPFIIDDRVVNSSTIRSLLREGKVHTANVLLGRTYRLAGTVIRGDGRGRKLGYPTANVQLSDPKKLLPRNGIYAVRVGIDGERYFGLMNIGVLPTFYEDRGRSCEVYILDFEKEVYGRYISIECLEWIREEKKFDSVDDLIREMDRDKWTGRNFFEKLSR